MRTLQRGCAVVSPLFVLPATVGACIDCQPRWPSCHGMAPVVERLPCLSEVLVDAFWLDAFCLSAGAPWTLVLGGRQRSDRRGADVSR